MTPQTMLQTLEAWQRTGWLRSLDLALARFIAEAEPTAPASLLLAAALAAAMEGRGHSGLPVHRPLQDLPGWPPDAGPALQEALAECRWPSDEDLLREAWRGFRTVEIEPVDDRGATPLVLAGGLLCLRRSWHQERRVAAQVRARTARVEAAGFDEPAITQARLQLDRLFPRAGLEAETDWQAVACALALRGRLTLVTGGPGTGKTFTAARLLVLLQSLHHGPVPLRVALAAPTGKAAARLRQTIGKALKDLGEDFGSTLGPARTLHSLLGSQPGTRRFRHDAFNPLDVDLLFVDEASMVHLEMMAQLLEALPAAARIVLLGDKDQLASVEAGAVMAELCRGAGQGYDEGTAAWVARLTDRTLPSEVCGAGSALVQQTVVLRRSHRFDGPIGHLARAVKQGEGALARALMEADRGGPVAGIVARDAGAVQPLVLQGRAGAVGGYRRYLDLLAQPAPAEAAAFQAWARAVLLAFDGFRVLCAVREGPWGVAGLNASIERALADAGLLARRGEWYPGRPVVVTRNDPALGVFNGDIGIVLRGPGGADAPLRCWFADGDELRSVAVARLAEVETAFAMTVHKSQGSEFDHVLLVLPDEDLPVLTRELVYTGITRARQAVTLLGAQPGLLATAIARLTQRVSGLGAML